MLSIDHTSTRKELQRAGQPGPNLRDQLLLTNLIEQLHDMVHLSSWVFKEVSSVHLMGTINLQAALMIRKVLAGISKSQKSQDALSSR